MNTALRPLLLRFPSPKPWALELVLGLISLFRMSWWGVGREGQRSLWDPPLSPDRIQLRQRVSFSFLECCHSRSVYPGICLSVRARPTDTPTVVLGKSHIPSTIRGMGRTRSTRSVGSGICTCELRPGAKTLGVTEQDPFFRDPLPSSLRSLQSCPWEP